MNEEYCSLSDKLSIAPVYQILRSALSIPWLLLSFAMQVLSVCICSSVHLW